MKIILKSRKELTEGNATHLINCNLNTFAIKQKLFNFKMETYFRELLTDILLTRLRIQNSKDTERKSNLKI